MCRVLHDSASTGGSWTAAHLVELSPTAVPSKEWAGHLSKAFSRDQGLDPRCQQLSQISEDLHIRATESHPSSVKLMHLKEQLVSSPSTPVRCLTFPAPLVELRRVWLSHPYRNVSWDFRHPVSSETCSQVWLIWHRDSKATVPFWRST